MKHHPIALFRRYLLVLLPLMATLLTASAADSYQILTLGDSITAVYKYQPFLKKKLDAARVDYSMVGTLGTELDKHHGISGIGINGLADNINGDLGRRVWHHTTCTQRRD